MVEKQSRLTGDERVSKADDLAVRYNAGASVRQLAREEGRSYGWIHRLLDEAGVQMRSRGGQRGR